LGVSGFKVHGLDLSQGAMGGKFTTVIPDHQEIIIPDQQKALIKQENSLCFANNVNKPPAAMGVINLELVAKARK
jgi:hypothetical protein